MRRKKKPKKKTSSIPPITSEQEEFIKSLLKNPEDINSGNIKDHIHTPESALMVVEHLPVVDVKDLKLLLAIKDAFGQKDIQKAVKKSIFRLRHKGISIPGKKPQEEPPLSFIKTEVHEPKAYISPIDGTGSRGILLMLPLMPKGVDVGIGAVSYEEGITHFIYEKYSKKRSREVKDFFFENAGRAIETSMAHAVTILENAYNKNKINTSRSSSNYLRLRPWILENISPLDHPLIYDFIQPEDVPDNFRTDSRIEKLLGHELMESWLISPNRIWPILDEIAKAETSPIIISQEQKSGRINEIKEKAIKELFPDSKRLILKDELEEMAYLFYRLDEGEYALLSLASASTLTGKDSIIMTNPFLKVFLERSLDHYIKVMRETTGPEGQEKDHSPNIIIT